jgi:hypothetical protein
MSDTPNRADDDALLGPGSTATGGGTSQDAAGDGEVEPRMPPLDLSGNTPTQLADERTQHEDL